VAIGIRSAMLGLLLFVPALIVIRETQRAQSVGVPSSCRGASSPTSTPHGATGLVLLASGRYMENAVDIDELVQQGRLLHGFWVGLAQLPRSHPFTVRHLDCLFAAATGLAAHAVRPIRVGLRESGSGSLCRSGTGLRGDR
jgi:hypothetical protein